MYRRGEQIHLFFYCSYIAGLRIWMRRVRRILTGWIRILYCFFFLLPDPDPDFFFFYRIQILIFSLPDPDPLLFLFSFTGSGSLFVFFFLLPDSDPLLFFFFYRIRIQPLEIFLIKQRSIHKNIRNFVKNRLDPGRVFLVWIQIRRGGGTFRVLSPGIYIVVDLVFFVSD